MAFSLNVDATRWRAHADSVHQDVPSLVPVAKGNGYGFGLVTLAAEAQRLACETIAVGQLDEVPAVHETFLGDVLVLTPWHPAIDPDLPTDERLIVTAGHRETLHAFARTRTRVVVELLTSMRRFGLDEDELSQSLGEINALNLAGFALHLPLDAGGVSRVDEASSWITTLRRLHLSTHSIWVSHISDPDLALLRRRHPETTFRPRIGTRLWLGAPDSYQAVGTVLAAHATRKGQRYGYRQRRAPGDGHLLIVSGGTSHGVALTAPRSVGSLTARAKTAAIGGLEASGRSLSPFYIGEKRRWFAEPPHMQVSMIWLPGDVRPPHVGDEIDVDVRMTTASFDRLVLR
ncbi:MAG TPA: alanine racemase [Actinomycetes bacterium]|nr:alanine racemase [Actinomycetes bacterium]